MKKQKGTEEADEKEAGKWGHGTLKTVPGQTNFGPAIVPPRNENYRKTATKEEKAEGQSWKIRSNINRNLSSLEVA